MARLGDLPAAARRVTKGTLGPKAARFTGLALGLFARV